MIYLQSVKVNPTIFPDKTFQVWKIDPKVLAECEKHNIAEILFESSLPTLRWIRLRKSKRRAVCSHAG